MQPVKAWKLTALYLLCAASCWGIGHLAGVRNNTTASLVVGWGGGFVLLMLILAALPRRKAGVSADLRPDGRKRAIGTWQPYGLKTDPIHGRGAMANVGISVRAIVLSVVGAVLSAGVAIHEWMYHQDHKYAPGVSGVLVVLALAVTVACLAIADVALTHQREQIRQMRDASAAAGRSTQADDDESGGAI
jgi:hypothetical protein